LLYRTENVFDKNFFKTEKQIITIMKNTKENTSKRIYCRPRLERILLDNEIALVLESNPPFGPNESTNNLKPEYFNTDPYATNRV